MERVALAVASVGTAVIAQCPRDCRKDDKAPEAWFQPLVWEGRQYRITDYYGTSTLTREDLERFLDDYYDERGYDRQSGLPTQEKLKELGLESLPIGGL